MNVINGRVASITGNRVATGPFAGMIVPMHSPWDDGNLGTKLCGTYEHELHDPIDVALRRRPSTIINVGCAEGFYAIGLAKLAPQAEVWGLDTNRASLALCARMAKENGVEVRLAEGAYAPADLSRGCGRRLFVVDCEGNEQYLLDPDRCPALRESDLIIECHDYLRAGISGTLAKRFAGTHMVMGIEPQAPDPLKYPFLASDVAWTAEWDTREVGPGLVFFSIHTVTAGSPPFGVEDGRFSITANAANLPTF